MQSKNMREKVRDLVAIGFSFISDWLKKGREILKPVTYLSNNSNSNNNNNNSNNNNNNSNNNNNNNSNNNNSNNNNIPANISTC